MWRLISDGAGTGAWNMAVDEAILEACIAGMAPPTLRIYSWAPPAISLGHFQRPEKALFLDTCKARGIEAARRPTGGRAILHDKEITFSIITPLSALGTTGVMDSYRYLADGIIRALHTMNVPAELIDRNSESPAAHVAVDKASPAACFAVKSRCDLMVAGKKIVGSAQVHRNNVVLQQNSLPFVIDAAAWTEVFRGMEGVAESAIGLWQAAGREVPFTEVAMALQQGFAQALGIEFCTGELTATEKDRAAEIVPACQVLAPR
jgi:lipoyl(octanoyl) transferase